MIVCKTPKNCVMAPPTPPAARLGQNLPSKEDHLHVATGEHFSDPCHLAEETPHLLDLLLCGNRVQVLVSVSI